VTRAQAHLERPVAFVTAAKKLAKVRGDRGAGGGWIRDRNGRVVCQGWGRYGQLMFTRGLLAQDDEHNGRNGKWYVWVVGLSAEELARAEVFFGEARRAPRQPLGPAGPTFHDLRVGDRVRVTMSGRTGTIVKDNRKHAGVLVRWDEPMYGATESRVRLPNLEPLD